MAGRYKKHLILTFDAFNTLFTPRFPVPAIYADAAYRHGIDCGDPSDPKTLARLSRNFNAAFKKTSIKHPNYGKASGITASRWWAAVIIATLRPYLPRHNRSAFIPQHLIVELLQSFSSKRGYMLYPDVLPFFDALRERKKLTTITTTPPTPAEPQAAPNPADPPPPHHPSNFLPHFSTITTGIITNSDHRVPSILSSLGLTLGPYRAVHKLSAAPTTPTDRMHDLEFVVSSYHADAEKPDAAMWKYAGRVGREILDRRGLDWGMGRLEVVHVGDDLARDVRGAEGAGWRAVHMCRGREGGGGDGRVERISSLEELPRLLSRVNLVRSVHLSSRWPKYGGKFAASGPE